MFYLSKIENARMNVPEPVFYEAAADEAISIGEALVLNDGKLTKCGATTAPQFISMGEVDANATDRVVAACRVEHNQLYIVPVNADPTNLKFGDKLTVADDGLQVTATTTNGVVTVEDTNGAKASGDCIVVRI